MERFANMLQRHYTWVSEYFAVIMLVFSLIDLLMGRVGSAIWTLLAAVVVKQIPNKKE